MSRIDDDELSSDEEHEITLTWPANYQYQEESSDSSDDDDNTKANLNHTANQTNNNIVNDDDDQSINHQRQELNEAGSVMMDIFSIAAFGELETLQKLIQQSSDRSMSDIVSEKDVYGMTLLHYAAQSGHAHLVSWLLQNGAHVNATDAMQQTPLILASAGGYIDVVNILIDSNSININAQDLKGRTALHWASSHNHQNVVNALLVAGGNSNIKDSTGSLPLGWLSGFRSSNKSNTSTSTTLSEDQSSQSVDHPQSTSNESNTNIIVPEPTIASMYDSDDETQIISSTLPITRPKSDQKVDNTKLNKDNGFPSVSGLFK